MKIGRILYKDHPELNAKNIRKLGNYKFEIEFQYFSGANTFLINKIDSSLNMKAFIPTTLTHVKGIVKNIDQDITNEEIIEFSSNVERFPITGVHRFTRKTLEDDGTVAYIPTKTCLLTFRSQKLPQKIKLFNCSLPVDTYVERIRQCGNCGKYGHSTKICRNKTICLQCSNEHPTQECDNVTEGIRNYKCVNCGLPHNANARICPVYKREENIRTKISELKINRYDAIQILEGTTSYADITRTMLTDNPHNISPWSPIGKPMPPEKVEEFTKLTKTPPKRKGQVSERLQTTRHTKHNTDHANWMNHYKRERIGFRTDEPTTPKTRKIDQSIVEEEEDQLPKVTQIPHPKMDKNPTIETLKHTYENLNKILPSTTLSNRNRIEKCITDLKTLILKLSDSA